MKIGFSGKTSLDRIDKKRWLVKQPLSFESDVLKVTVKAGFITDGASIPRPFWAIIGCPMDGQYIGSAIVHDGLYNSHLLSQKESDILFKEMLKNNGVDIVRRNIMYGALRTLGWYSYNKKSLGSIAFNSELVSVQYKK